MPTELGQVRLEGLRELRRDLKRIDKTLPRELNKRLKVAAEPMRVDAVSRAPRRTGRLRASIKLRTSGSSLFLGSSLPYAKVVHWGGRHPLFGNRDRWVANPRRPFIQQAARAHSRDLEKAVFAVVDDLMRSAGFTPS